MKSLMTSPRLAILAGIAFMTPAFAVVSVDWVTVGDAANAPDPLTGYGAVASTYRIARNETTIADYAQFLNAVAASDPYGLYNFQMEIESFSGIQRTGSSGSYTYSVLGSGDRPITFVSWYDAARFVNWLHNGQGSGDTETGAYTLNGVNSTMAPARNPGATVWIPTENEWYKAAYYDPTKNGGTGGYWLHANRSDSMTSNDMTVAGAANYFAGNYAKDVNGLTSYLSDVGAYGADSQSYYGTNDQTGNVREWNDYNGEVDSWRGLHGGSWFSFTESQLRSTNREIFGAELKDSYVGFRIASSIPEPNSLVLTVLFSAALLVLRKRARGQDIGSEHQNPRTH